MIMGDIIDNSTVENYSLSELQRHIVFLWIVYKEPWEVFHKSYKLAWIVVPHTLFYHKWELNIVMEN